MGLGVSGAKGWGAGLAPFRATPVHLVRARATRVGLGLVGLGLVGLGLGLGLVGLGPGLGLGFEVGARVRV